MRNKALFSPGEVVLLRIEELKEEKKVTILDVIPKKIKDKTVYFYVTDCDDYPIVAEFSLKKIEIEN